MITIVRYPLGDKTVILDRSGEKPPEYTADIGVIVENTHDRFGHITDYKIMSVGDMAYLYVTYRKRNS